MSTRYFTMTDDQIDNLIIEELRDAHERNLTLDKDEGGSYMDPDWELLKALETVLEYYTPRVDHEVWARNAALKKLTLTSELMGGYDE